MIKITWKLWVSPHELLNSVLTTHNLKESNNTYSVLDHIVAVVHTYKLPPDHHTEHTPNLLMVLNNICLMVSFLLATKSLKTRVF